MRTLGAALVMVIGLTGTAQAAEKVRATHPTAKDSALSGNSLWSTMVAVRNRIYDVQAGPKNSLGGIRMPDGRAPRWLASTIHDVGLTLVHATRKRWIPKAGLRTNLRRLFHSGPMDDLGIGKATTDYALSQTKDCDRALAQALISLARMPEGKRWAQIERDIPAPPKRRSQQRSSKRDVYAKVTKILSGFGYDPDWD